MKKEKFDYKKYLQSRDWLIKKTKLVNRYLRRKREIKCFVCDGLDGLIVHHWDYENIGKEKLEDLIFMCYECHRKWHKEKGFKENWEREGIDEMINDYKNKIGVFAN